MTDLAVIHETFVQTQKDDRTLTNVRPGEDPAKKRSERRANPVPPAPITPT